MFSACEVAEIVGLQESRVRYWAQTGVVSPSERRGGKVLYNFQDLVGVKAAKELLDRGVSLQAVRKNLEALRQQLPHVDRPLAQLRIVSDGERLVVAGEHAPFEPLTRQVVMDFQLAALEGRAAEVAELPRAPEHPQRETAWALYLEGTRLDSDPARAGQALVAYRQALASDPQLAVAHTNIGNLLYRGRDHAGALTHYEAALAIDPEQPEARYNLANLLDEAGDSERAIAEWFRVVSTCPEFADAHFNLAAAFLREGSRERARIHLQRYIALDGQAGEWAERAREILRTL